jgi:phage-related protein
MPRARLDDVKRSLPGRRRKPGSVRRVRVLFEPCALGAGRHERRQHHDDQDGADDVQHPAVQSHHSHARFRQPGGPAKLRIIRTRAHGVSVFRRIYLAKFLEGVYVLHAFEKRTRQTAKDDLDLARQRLRLLLNQRARRKE